MRFWAGVLTALLLHVLLLAGTRGCRPSLRETPPTEVAIVVAPPTPPPPPPVAAPPTPAPTAAPPRLVRPPPRQPRRAGLATLAAGALRPSLTASDFVVAGDSGATSVGLGEGVASGAGVAGPAEASDPIAEAEPPRRPGCREGDFGGIWVVDDRDRLAAFDPETGRFRLVGLMRCDPRPPYEAHTKEWEAHPYSMTVDRAGRAWVLYTSGELFRVSTATAACSRTSWVPGRSGYELFALGYVADRAGRERLYIAGGRVAEMNRGDGRIAVLDRATLEPQSLGAQPRGHLGPELTGTADGQLYAFYVGEKLVALDGISPRATYRLPAAASDRSQSWAFAEWGGAFYLFASEGGKNRVLRFEPERGRLLPVVASSPYRVVGAGVSGCSPVTSPLPGSSPSPAPPAP